MKIDAGRDPGADLEMNYGLRGHIGDQQKNISDIYLLIIIYLCL